MDTQQPSSTPRAAVVINPTKNSDPDLRDRFFVLCEDLGWSEPLWLETTAEDPGHGQTQEALEAKVDVVIAAGGDGTVRSVASVLTDTDTPMGLMPLGTGNLLARNIGINISDPLEAARDALNGQLEAMDVVKAVIDHGDQTEIFLVAAGMGYDAAIMANTIDGLKDRVGWLAYVEAGIRHLPGEPVRATISIDGQHALKRKVRGVMVGNCGKLMGGVEIFQNAAVNDGIVDLLTLAPRGRFGWLQVILGMFRKDKSKNDSIHDHQAKSAEITFEIPQELQLDGDHLGTASHLSVKVAPKALKLRMSGGL